MGFKVYDFVLDITTSAGSFIYNSQVIHQSAFISNVQTFLMKIIAPIGESLKSFFFDKLSNISLFSSCMLISIAISIFRTHLDHKQYEKFVTEMYQIPYLTNHEISRGGFRIRQKNQQKKENPMKTIQELHTREYKPKTRKHYPSKWYRIGCDMMFNASLCFLRWKMYETLADTFGRVMTAEEESISWSWSIVHFGIGVVGCEFMLRSSSSFMEYLVTKFM